MSAYSDRVKKHRQKVAKHLKPVATKRRIKGRPVKHVGLTNRLRQSHGLKTVKVLRTR